MGRFLSIEDLEWAADKIGCELAVVRAVDEVESRGEGFNPDGSPTILFEGHKFHKYTDGKYTGREEYRDISYSRWTRDHYATGRTREIRQQGEYQRFKKAAELDEVAAIKSTSWGRYQIMGFNYDIVGFDDIYNFYYAMGTSEYEHLKAFIEYCTNRYYKGKSVAYWMKVKNFENVAGGYNGSGQISYYSTKMKEAYEDFS